MKRVSPLPVPARPLPDVVEDFAAPLLDPLRGQPELGPVRVAMDFAVAVWNFHVLVRAPWGGKKAMQEAFAGLERVAPPPGHDRARKILDQRWVARFSGDPRVVDALRVEQDAERGFHIVCEARLPKNAAVTVATPAPGAASIAINEHFLGEVRVPAGPTMAIGFPAERHSARVEGDMVTIYAQAPAVAKLFAEGILGPIGGPPVTIEVAGARLGWFVLTGLGVGPRDAVNDVLVLTFRRATFSVGAIRQ